MELDRYRPILNNGVYPDTSLEKARQDVAWYKQLGYGGFAINGTTRQPVDDVRDWLPGFLTSCQNYVQAAKEQGMNVWIFDEWGYPSGTACGQVLDGHPEYRAKKLRICYDVLLEPGQSVQLPCTEKFISAAAFPADYFSFYSPADKGVRVLPQDGMLCYTASGRTRLVAVEWEYLTFVTHVMKKTVPGDPTIGTIDILNRDAVARFLQCMHEWYVPAIGHEFGKTVQGFFYDEPEICYDFPYTDELPAAFEQACGYSVGDILPELLAWMPAQSGLISLDGAHGRIKKEFDDYSHVWCDLLARNFYGQIQAWCHAHRLLSVGHQDLDNQLVTLRTVSGDFWANNVYNDRPGVDVIWDQIAPDKFSDFPRYAGCAKRTWGKSGAISETFAEMGPSMYPDRMRWCMEHQILRGIDQFFLYTNHSPDDLNVSCFAAAVNDRVTRTANLYNQGKPCAQTAIYVPMDAIAFAAAHSDPHLHNSDPQPWQRVDDLARQLCYRPVQYDYVWQGTVETLAARGITTVLLAGETELPAADITALRAFCAGGGQVLCIGKPCTALEDAALYCPTVRAAFDRLPVATLALQPKQGGAVSMTACILPQEQRYFLLNESAEPAVLAVSHAVAGAWQILEPVSGVWQPVDMTADLHFHSCELKILRRVEQGSPEKPYVSGAVRQLNDWLFTGPDGKTAPLPALQPWTALGLGDYTGFATYETQFDWGGGLAQLDLGDVRFAAVVQLDGVDYQLPLSPYRLQLDIPAGRHMLRVQVLNSNANRLYAGPDTGRSNFEGHYWTLYQFERAYRDCGLLGPVTLTALQK